jgi:DNA-binding CsgD family transcriptional regulator
VLDVLNRNPLPALILEVPSERLLALSPAAQELFSVQGTELVGRSLWSVIADAPSGALEMLVAGRLNGYEAVRQVRLGDGSIVPLQTWVRTIGDESPPRHVLFVFTTEVEPVQSVGPVLSEDFNALIGTIDASLRIDRIRSDIDGSPEPEELVGKTIFQIVHPDGLSLLMWALAQSTSTGKGVALHVRVNRAAGKAQLCQMLLLPTAPFPSFAFSLVPAERPECSPDTDADASLHATRGTDVFGASRGLAGITEADVTGISELSSREFDVLSRLLAGHRVPAIAGALFISQSTVRNHLSSMFKKLGVESQQELIDLLMTRMDATASDK